MPGLVKEYKRFMNERISIDLKTFKDIPQVIAKLHKNFRLGILTSNSKENVEMFLKNNDIKNYFDFVFSDSSIFGKAVILKRLLKELELKKNEIIYIGDENRDIIASKKVGITSIAVTWGYNSKDLLIKEKPDYMVGSPKEILICLKQYNFQRKKLGS
ncbi:MAG: HAD-IA family hydrolase [Candidatus Pacearchaeota archaeon]|nr:HAD-IA family hydrolase [Candidatus Pacearchaeota archaeon]